MFAATIKGIIFCVISSGLNALGSVIQAKSLKDGFDIYELMIWRGLVGAVLTGIEFYFIELDSVLSYEYNTKIILLIASAVLCLLVFSIVLPFYIQKCTALMFNICQASQIFWSMLVNLIFLHENVRLLDNS